MNSEIVYNSKRSKILDQFEKEIIRYTHSISSMETISIDSLLCAELGAKEFDIILISNLKKYLLVVGRYPLV